MNKVLIFLLGLIWMACEAPSTETIVGDFADLPPGAIQIPYPGNNKLVNVVQTGSDGKVIQKGDYLNGLRDGTWVEYYPSGVVKTTSGYREGKLHGTYISVDNRGAIIEKVDFVEGLKNGVYYKYERGRIIHEMNYSNDVIHGVFRRYYANGNLQEESNYANGVLDGEARWYDQQGNVTIEYTYSNGELVDQGN